MDYIIDMKQTEKIFEDWLAEDTEIEDLPSWELLARAGKIMSSVASELGEAQNNPSIENLRSMAAANLMLAEDSETKKLARMMFIVTFTQIEDLIQREPEASSSLISIAATLIAASQFVICGNALKRHKNFSARISPLAEKNTKSSQRSDRACVIASDLWAADSDNEFRLLDMATQVRDILEREGEQGLPQIDRIKEWIKKVAPDYARRPGRGKAPNRNA